MWPFKPVRNIYINENVAPGKASEFGHWFPPCRGVTWPLRHGLSGCAIGGNSLVRNSGVACLFEAEALDSVSCLSP